MNSEINYLLSIESKGIKLGLKRTKSLLSVCQNPQKKLNVVQVTGTNGKTTVTYFVRLLTTFDEL